MDENRPDSAKNQKRRQSNVNVKKQIQYMQSLSPEERDQVYEKLHRPALEVKPKTFKEKRQNYWYHYKWHTIGGIFAMVLVVVFIVDFVTKARYDMEFMLVTANFYNMDAQEDVLGAFTEYGTDFDGNGEVLFDMMHITMNNEEYANSDPNMHSANVVKFSASLMDATHLIMIVDEINYRYLKYDSELTFVDLSYYSDNPNIDGERYRINDDPVLGDLALQDDLYLIVRSLDGNPTPSLDAADERFQYEMSIVENLLNQTPVPAVS